MSQKIYTLPDVTTIPDDARIYLYDPAAGAVVPEDGNKNLTGAGLKTTLVDVANAISVDGGGANSVHPNVLSFDGGGASSIHSSPRSLNGGGA